MARYSSFLDRSRMYRLGVRTARNLPYAAKVGGFTFLYLFTFVGYFLNNVAERRLVTGQSMAPALSPDFHEAGKMDQIVISKRFRLSDDPRTGAASDLRRGMVVEFWTPHNPEKLALKRIIGLEGDVVTPLSRQKGRKGRKVAVIEPVTVPFGHVWVEGDNQEESLDSNDYGPISKSLINGVATRIVRPKSRRSDIVWENWDDKNSKARVKRYVGKYEWPEEWEI